MEDGVKGRIQEKAEEGMGGGRGPGADPAPCRAFPGVALLALLLACAPPAAAASPAPGAGPASGAPSLEVSDAVYRADLNVLEFAFTVANPTDSVLYVDCQGQPEAARRGGDLALAFAARDSAAADTARPQRVGARQTFRGHRRIFGLGPDASGGPGRPADPAAASRLRVEMAVYPGREEGEGEAWLRDRAVRLAAPAAPLARKGKRPPPPAPVRIFKLPAD